MLTGMHSVLFVGVPGHGIYDNMKAAVDRVGRGKQRDINARFKVLPPLRQRRRYCLSC